MKHWISEKTALKMIKDNIPNFSDEEAKAFLEKFVQEHSQSVKDLDEIPKGDWVEK